MGDGAFRDVGAALERAAALQARNEELEAELRAGGPRGGESEIARLRAELKDSLTKLAAMTRDLAAAEANYRALRNTDASDEGVRLREENARLREARDNANRVIAEMQAEADETARWKAEAGKLESTLTLARLKISSLETKVKETSLEPEVVTEVPPNLQAFMKRLQEERDELAAEVRDLDAKLKAQQPKTFLARLLKPR